MLWLGSEQGSVPEKPCAVGVESAHAASWRPSRDELLQTDKKRATKPARTTKVVVWRIDTQLPVPERRPHTHPSRRKPMPQTKRTPPGLPTLTYRPSDAVAVRAPHGTDVRAFESERASRARTHACVRCRTKLWSGSLVDTYYPRCVTWTFQHSD